MTQQLDGRSQQTPQSPSASDQAQNQGHLDHPERIHEIRRLIKGKPFLRRFYQEVYGKYAACIERCPPGGIVLELGSGGSFVKEFLPNAGVLTSDTLAYDGIDQVIDATHMPFQDGALRSILMMNVFHHIPDVEAFLKEAQRCLKPGGRLFMLDQHPGWISTPILSGAHHEPFEPGAKQWAFPSTGPLSGANGALAWIVFKRDRQRFESSFPHLELVGYKPHSPLRYWVSGGLKSWSLAPGWAFPVATMVDKALVSLSEQFGSFTDVELRRRG